MRCPLSLYSEEAVDEKGGGKLKIKGKLFMSFGVMLVAAGVVVQASQWPLKTALFPVALGLPVFFMSLAVFLLDLFDKGEKKKGGSSPAVDFKLSVSENQEETNKRTIDIFLWILGWFVLILLVGFSLSIPIYFIAFLRFKSKESWKLTLILSGIAWAFFYGLFIWLLSTPFMDGWIQRGLMMLGILS
jgi:hypothetical protein